MTIQQLQQSNLHEIIKHAKDFAIKLHSDVNHKYDGLDYSTHLYMVYDTACQFSHLLPVEIKIEALASAWTHDLIEDCRVTYNDIKREFGETIAEITYALTNEKGRNRKDRANEKYYEGIRNTPGATFVKLCDRMANVLYARIEHTSMYNVYKRENEDFCSHLYTPDLQEMFTYLKKAV
ncbi:MAG: hypothetical protein KF862_07465 [Chitinophagaceae bacterium]|nr:hypothetical protein [Chitinophagaceae bacterium]